MNISMNTVQNEQFTDLFLSFSFVLYLCKVRFYQFYQLSCFQLRAFEHFSSLKVCLDVTVIFRLFIAAGSSVRCLCKNVSFRIVRRLGYSDVWTGLFFPHGWVQLLSLRCATNIRIEQPVDVFTCKQLAGSVTQKSCKPVCTLLRLFHSRTGNPCGRQPSSWAKECAF